MFLISFSFVLIPFHLISFFHSHLHSSAVYCQDSPFHLISFFTLTVRLHFHHKHLLLFLPFLFSSLSHGQINSPPQERISTTSTNLIGLKKSLSVEACMVESLSPDFKCSATIEFVFWFWFWVWVMGFQLMV